jgi:hypothetical protein
MNQKLNNIACKVIGYAGYIFLTLFAVVFAVTCCGVFIVAVSSSDFLALIISAICALCAWACWIIRKDTLV